MSRLSFRAGARGGGFYRVSPLAASAAEPPSNGAMIALYPTPPQAEALAIEGGQPADELHLTLVYLGDADGVNASEVRDALGDDLGRPLGGQAGDVFQFPKGDDGVPLNVSPAVEGLEDFRAELVRRLAAAGIEDASSFSDWVPHICLGYDNDPAEAEGKVGLPLSFDSVAVVVAGERTDVALTASIDDPAERWDAIVQEVEQDETEPEPVLASLEVTSAASETFAMLRLAANEAEAARAREFAALKEAQTRDQGTLREVLGALRALAIKPSGDTHVTVPTELHPHVTVHEPDITIEPAAAPDVHVQVEPPAVTVEAAAPAPSPDVHVAAPDVHVTVEAPVPPDRRPIRATKAEDGTMTFEVVEDE